MKTIFWNVDTQYDFMRDDEDFKGALAIPNAISIEENLEKITLIAEKKGMRVINTADWHDENTSEISATPDYVNTFPKHCMQNTVGAEYVPATRPKEAYVINWDAESIDKEKLLNYRNIIIRKDKFDAFIGNPHTTKVLDELKPERVIVYGVATNYCVKYAVQGLLDHKKTDGKNLEVLVVEDAIKEIPNEPKENTINYWKEKGIKMIETKDLERYI